MITLLIMQNSTGKFKSKIQMLIVCLGIDLIIIGIIFLKNH